jgi:hypothetical protein
MRIDDPSVRPQEDLEIRELPIVQCLFIVKGKRISINRKFQSLLLLKMELNLLIADKSHLIVATARDCVRKDSYGNLELEFVINRDVLQEFGSANVLKEPVESLRTSVDRSGNLLTHAVVHEELGLEFRILWHHREDLEKRELKFESYY